MNEKTLNFETSFVASYLFLDGLYDKYVNRSENLSYKDKTEFGIFMGEAFCLMKEEWTYNWNNCITQFYGVDKTLYRRKIIEKNVSFIHISPQDTFTALLHFTTSFCYPCPFLIGILNGMLNSPDNYKDEWKMWENAVNDALTGNHKLDIWH